MGEDESPLNKVVLVTNGSMKETKKGERVVVSNVSLD